MFLWDIFLLTQHLKPLSGKKYIDLIKKRVRVEKHFTARLLLEIVNNVNKSSARTKFHWWIKWDNVGEQSFKYWLTKQTTNERIPHE